jgi:hypothetical protein
MLKYYASKFAMDILPSVAATIIGAYIVNHYIASKPAADAPAAAAVSSSDPKKADSKSAAKPSETSTDVASIPGPGVKAKGISEKAINEKSASEKSEVEKPAEGAGDKPAETASIPVDRRRHQPAPREKAIAKTVAAPVQPVAPAIAPVVAAPATAAPATAAPPVEAAVPEERRDANDLARAAIERLRDTSPRLREPAASVADTPRIPDQPRNPEPPRVVSTPPAVVSTPQAVVSAPAVRPLPPPIMVSTPAAENFGAPSGSSQIRPSYTGAPQIEDAARPTPPADIPFTQPGSRPLDLHAEATEPPPREHRTVAEDVLSAAKSVFHAVLPK